MFPFLVVLIFISQIKKKNVSLKYFAQLISCMQLFTLTHLTCIQFHLIECVVDIPGVLYKKGLLLHTCMRIVYDYADVV